MNQSARNISVSVILPTFNRAHLLSQALDSILQQTRPPEEIIVINDSSTDNTSEVLKGYHDRIVCITNNDNKGKPAALNCGIALANSSHLWIFDDDDVALPDALKIHIQYLESHEGIDFSYSDKYVFTGDGDIWDRSNWHLSRLPDISPEEFRIRTMESMNTLMQGMLIPAYCYQKVGLFDETLHRCEDQEMLLRLNRSFRAANVGHPTFVYRDHAELRGLRLKGISPISDYKCCLDMDNKFFVI